MTADQAHATLSGHSSSVLLNEWNPSADFCLATASADRTVKIWDVKKEEQSYSIAFSSSPSSLEWSHDGDLLASVNSQSELSLFDPRVKNKIIEIQSVHDNKIPQKLKWLGSTGKILTVGASDQRTGRQYAIHDLRLLKQGPVTYQQLDQQLAPFSLHYEEAANLIFVSNKGRNPNIGFFQLEDNEVNLYEPALHFISSFNGFLNQEELLQEGTSVFLPRRALDQKDNELARAFLLHGKEAEYFSFKIPKSYGQLQYVDFTENDKITFLQWDRGNLPKDQNYVNFERYVKERSMRRYGLETDNQQKLRRLFSPT